MVNPASIFKIKSAWEKFASNHPKFPMFLQAAMASGIKEELYYRSKDHGSGGKADLYKCKTDRIGYGIIPYLKGSEGVNADNPINAAYFFIKLKNREYV